MTSNDLHEAYESLRELQRREFGVDTALASDEECEKNPRQALYYTELGDTCDYPIQLYIDFSSLTISAEMDGDSGTLVGEERYKRLEDLIGELRAYCISDFIPNWAWEAASYWDEGDRNYAPNGAEWRDAR